MYWVDAKMFSTKPMLITPGNVGTAPIGSRRAEHANPVPMYMSDA